MDCNLWDAYTGLCLDPRNPYHRTLMNWLFHSTFWTSVLYVIIALVVIAVVWRWIWYRYVFLQRDLCVDCLKGEDPVETRTTLCYQLNEQDCEAVCAEHYNQRIMDAEPVYTCPRDNIKCWKEWSHGRLVHCCPQGCTFIPEGRYQAILAHMAKANSGSSWNWTSWTIGFAAGLTIGKGSHY